MSLFATVNLVCPKCETAMEMEAVGSVNADRRPDFRDAILDDSFQDVECGECGEKFRLQPEFNYLDAGRGQWIASMPANGVPNYLATEDDVTALFSQTYGTSAPKAAQEVGAGLDVRLTFGWPALREKLFVRQENLDDITLEMVKLDLLRRVPEAPMAQGVELRLVDASDEFLTFLWQETATERPLQEVQVDRALYDEVAGQADGWKPVREQLEDGPFVDIQKLYMGAGRAA